MNKQLLFASALLLVAVFSTGALYACEVNDTDTLDAQVMGDDADLPVAVDDDVSRDNNVSSDIENAMVVDSDSSQHPTEIINPKDTIYYNGPYCLILVDGNNTFIANKKITVVINNVDYIVITDNEGIAKIDLSLKPGQYAVTASFAGDENYLSSHLSTKVNILPSIQAKNIVKYYKGSAKYKATFYTVNGTALANTAVKIKVKGKTYTVKTNAKGVASLAINLKPGTYKVTTINPANGYQLTTTFKILPTITANNIKKVYTDGRKFSAKFYKSNGKVLAKKYIKFRLHGKTYNVKTNKNGVASLSLKKLKKGTYKIISYSPDGLKIVNIIKVYKRVGTSLISKDYTFSKYQSNKVIKVRLLNKFGYAPSKGKVIKFKFNGKKYSRTTNKNGYVSLKLPTLKVGVYKITYRYSGNKMYKASKGSKKITINNKVINPYGTKKNIVYLNSDLIHGYSQDMKVLKQISSLLKKAGFKTKICGVGPSEHYNQRDKVKNGIWFCIYGGACASTLKETANNEWFRKPLVNHGSRTVVGFLPPAGDIRKGGKYYEWLPRARDDGFSDKTFKGLSYPADYLTDHAIPFMYGNSVKELVSKFLKGGDNKEACNKNWKFITKADAARSPTKSKVAVQSASSSNNTVVQSQPVILKNVGVNVSSNENLLFISSSFNVSALSQLDEAMGCFETLFDIISSVDWQKMEDINILSSIIDYLLCNS